MALQIGNWSYNPPINGVMGPYLQLSHEKNPLTFHYTGCLIGILIIVYYNPHITG